jgi:hypothetical protein
MGARIKSFTEHCYALKSFATKDFLVSLATVSGTPAIIAS